MTLRPAEPLLAPSLLAADFTRLADALRVLETAGGCVVHVDVMDGRFVPNITIGLPVVEALRRETRLPLDCHLMIVEPLRYAAEFVAQGGRLGLRPPGGGPAPAPHPERHPDGRGQGRPWC